MILESKIFGAQKVKNVTQRQNLNKADELKRNKKNLLVQSNSQLKLKARP